MNSERMHRSKLPRWLGECMAHHLWGCLRLVIVFDYRIVFLLNFLVIRGFWAKCLYSVVLWTVGCARDLFVQKLLASGKGTVVVTGLI